MSPSLTSVTQAQEHVTSHTCSSPGAEIRTKITYQPGYAITGTLQSQELNNDEDTVTPSHITANKLTRRCKTACGTPRYMAPEIYATNTSSRVYGSEVDVWGAGCVLYELLCGEPAFADTSRERIQVRVVNRDYDHTKFPQCM